MDSRTLISYSFLLFIVLNIEVSSSSSVEETGLGSLNLKVPVELGASIPNSEDSIESSESKVSKRYIGKIPNESYNKDSEEEDVDGAPPDHVVPYTDHEDPDEPATKPKYTKPGDWAKPPPDRDIPLDFVPTKLYAQVRGSHTVKHLPREEAFKSAETPEEILAASRLREVVSKSKTNTIYTEEGYEDAAYDHAGHIRDADFHEGYARKLKDQRKGKRGGRKEPEEDEKEDIQLEEPFTTEEFNEYNDDYRDHTEESSRIDESKIQKGRDDDGPQKYRSLKGLWRNSDIKPKRIAENEIERLEEDLEAEYKEAEKNTETEVPENLKKSRNDYDEEEDESARDQDSANEYDYGKRINAKTTVSSPRSEDINDADSTSGNPARLTKLQDSQSFPGRSSTTPNYGNVFWNYFKLVGDKWKPREVSTPRDVTTTIREDAESVPEVLTSVPNFASVQTTIGDIKTFSFNPPNTEMSDFVFASRSMDPLYPSASSLYDSWKRRDSQEDSEENEDLGIAESASNLYPTLSEESADLEKNPTLNLQNDDTSTTLIGPKKLSYTVIIRSNEKTTKKPPCDREDNTRLEESNSIEKLTRPKYKDTLKKFRDEFGPEAIDDFALQQDFTVIRPPLPAPLGQVTFADFLSHPYASLARPSGKQESGQLEQETNGGRDHYNVIKSPYENLVQNHLNHASELSNVPHHRGPSSIAGHKINHHHHHHHHLHYSPPTELVPPSPLRSSKYSEYYGMKRNEKPKLRINRSSSLDPWAGLVRLYQSIDRSIFGKRRRRSVHSDEKIEAMNSAFNIDGKVNHRSIDISIGKNLRPERNFFYEEANRLVPREKLSVRERRKRGNENLLNKAPRIVEDVINAEIESRFKDEKSEENEEENSKNEENDDSRENERGKIEIEVPDFNFTEVVENNRNEKVISKSATKTKILDIVKYPFYENSKVPRSSALKYITNPRQVPRKTLGGTEFYDSRDRYLECDEVNPDLEKVVPEDEEPVADREPRGDQPRLRGLGDKLDCFKAKYFDENPLDNPLFTEKQVDQPQIPEELDPSKFASRILSISNVEDKDERKIDNKISRKPEIQDLRRSGSKRNQVAQEEIQNYRKKLNNNTKLEKVQSNHKNKLSERHRQRVRPLLQTNTEPRQIYPVTPYQREVYEDVMGTIKNLENIYQTYGESISIPSIQSNVNYLTNNPREQTWNFPVVHITEKPRNFMIHGLLPPQAPAESRRLQRYRLIPYRTNKVSYRMKTRNENPPGSEGTKVGYFKTVRVHKRSIDDSKLSDLDTEESRNVPVRRIKNSGNHGNSRGMRKSENVENDEKSAASEKIVYTIRDRIRHSKPREDLSRNGKFTNLEAAGTEDVRRKEPRYSRIRRKEVPSSSIDTSTSSQLEGVEDIKSEQPVESLKNSTEKDKTIGRPDFLEEPGEIYKIQFSTTRGKQAAPSEIRRNDKQESISSENEEEEEEEKDKELDENSTKIKQQQNQYAVHEKVDENPTTASSLPDPTKSPEVIKLQKYLKSEPPGYSEIFVEEATEPSVRSSEDEEQTKSGESVETRRQGNDDEGEEENEEEDEANDEKEEQAERPSESNVDEESSPKSEEAEDERESSEKSGSVKNAEDDEEDGGEVEEQSPRDVQDSNVDGEKEFHRFASRPYSPFESYEDPKFSDLGPRISKPAFHHPTFSVPASEKYRAHGRDQSAESEDDSREEENKKISRYVFPWEQDEADEAEESKPPKSSVEKYEYPWEKRERLARERRRNQKEREEYEKLYGFPIIDDDEIEEEEQDASNSELHKRRVYPWDHYQVKSKPNPKRKPSRIAKVIDNDEMSSEYRPVTKFSSRYRSRIFNLNNDEDPIVASGADPSEIKVSIIKAIVDASTDKPSKILKNNIMKLNASTVAPPNNSSPAPTNSTTISRRVRNWNSRSINVTTPSPIVTVSSPRINRKSRIWRVASNTTKKPIRSRKRTINAVGNELLKSGSQKKEVTTNLPEKQEFKATPMIISLETSKSFVNNRKNKRRGQSINRAVPSAATTTSRPVRRRFQKSTETPRESETTTAMAVTERTTTPKSKTVEHRSRFSKEEIITKTSYPRMDPEDSDQGSNNKNEEVEDKSKEKSSRLSEIDRKGKNSKKVKNTMNESVKKVSIVTKETPEHIYRTEEVDKDGVKGMFVSITPNNGTKDSMDLMEEPEDRSVGTEETNKILKRFENSSEDEDDTGSSFLQDSHLLANLLTQVPPYMNNFTLAEKVEEGNSFLESEGSGTGEQEEEDVDDARKEFQINYIKHPNNRLYYYVEKRKR